MNKYAKTIYACAITGMVLSTTPAPAQSGLYTGTADMFKGIPLNCNVSANFDTATSTVVLSIDAPESFCALTTIFSNPHTYTSSVQEITIHDVNFNYPLVSGGCSDNLVVTYDATNDEILISDVLASREGGGECFIESNGPLTK